MLRFFRINDPYRLLAMLVLMVLFALPLLISPSPLTVQALKHFVLGEVVAGGNLMYAEIFDSTAPLSALVFGFTDWVFGRSGTARDVLTLLMLFFQAAFFGILLINNKAYNDNTYVPGLIFSLLCFVSFDFLSFSPELLASTLLLLALNNLFKEIEFRIQREEIILNLGVYLGAASLFVFSYSLFLIATLIILSVYTRISLRKALLLIFGFLLPHAILIVFYYHKNESGLLWKNFYEANFMLGGQGLVSWRSLLLLFALPTSFFVFSLFMLTREARFTKYQSQLFQVMFLWLLFSAVELLLTRERTAHSFITVIPSLTYFISHYLLLIRRRWIAELMLWVLLIGVLLINHLSRHDRMKSIDFSKMFVANSIYEQKISGKKVMVLGSDLSLYRTNELGSFFFDWPLSREVVMHPDYYENILVINESFGKNSPDVVVDKENIFPAIADRIPALKKSYRKDGELYWRISK